MRCAYILIALMLAVLLISGCASKENKNVSQNICEIGKQYVLSSAEPIECKCPEGYRFKTISPNYDSCSSGTSDCSAYFVECAGQANIEINASMEATTNCSESDCFEEKFKECKPATMDVTLTDMISYHYEIIGLKDGLCEVKSKFLTNPNPGWVGKEMTCKYDNTKDLESAVQDLSNCEGPLYNLMISG